MKRPADMRTWRFRFQALALLSACVVSTSCGELGLEDRIVVGMKKTSVEKLVKPKHPARSDDEGHVIGGEITYHSLVEEVDGFGATHSVTKGRAVTAPRQPWEELKRPEWLFTGTVEYIGQAGEPLLTIHYSGNKVTRVEKPKAP